MLWTNTNATVPEGGWAWRWHAWPMSHVTVAYAPRGSGAPSQKSRDRLKISKSSQRIEYTAWRCRDIMGILAGLRSFSKDVVHFVRKMPPRPPVFVLPVPAWALVICCRWYFFALKQLLARLASTFCNRRLSELRVQFWTLPCKGWTRTLTSQIVVGVIVESWCLPQNMPSSTMDFSIW